MRSLSERMNAGIRSARAVEFDLLIFENLFYRFKKFSLNCFTVFLKLPAAVAGAFVFYREFKSCHEYNVLKFFFLRNEKEKNFCKILLFQ